MLALRKRRVACFRCYRVPAENRTRQRRRIGPRQQLRVQKTIGHRSILRAGRLGARVWYHPQRRPCRAPHARRLCQRFPLENAIAQASAGRLRQTVIFRRLGTGEVFGKRLAETILSVFLIIPDKASHCDEHRDDRPSGDASNQNEKRKLDDIIPRCFSAEEFTA